LTLGQVEVVGAPPLWSSGKLEALSTLRDSPPDEFDTASFVVCGEDTTIADLPVIVGRHHWPLFNDLSYASHLSIGLRSLGAGYGNVTWTSEPPYGENVELQCGTLLLSDDSAFATSP
jgi:hypothetical protein